MTPLVEMLQRATLMPPDDLDDHVFRYLREAGESKLTSAAHAIGKASQTTDEAALYRIWTLVETHRLNCSRDMMVSLKK